MKTFVLYLIISLAYFSYAEERTFIDQKGRKLVAKLIEVKEDSVVLELKNGKLSEVKRSKFSANDEKYFQVQLKLKKEDDKLSKKISTKLSYIAIPSKTKGSNQMIYSVYDQSGNVIVKIPEHSGFNTGRSFKPNLLSGNTYLVEKELMYGKKKSYREVVMDFDGNTLLKPKSSYYISKNDWANTILRVGWSEDGKSQVTFVDQKGDFITDKRWQYARPMKEGRAFVSHTTMRGIKTDFELIDSTGKVIPVKLKNYEVLSDFNYGHALARTKSMQGTRTIYEYHYINRQGQVTTVNQSNQAAQPYAHGVAYTGSTIIDTKGKVLFKKKSNQSILGINHNYLLASDPANGVYILNYLTGKMVHKFSKGSFSYNSSNWYRCDLYEVQKEDAFFIVASREKGEQRNSKFGVVNYKGDWLIPLKKCDRIKYYNGFFLQKNLSGENELNSNYVLYNAKGKKLKEFNALFDYWY